MPSRKKTSQNQPNQNQPQQKPNLIPLLKSYARSLIRRTLHCIGSKEPAPDLVRYIFQNDAITAKAARQMLLTNWRITSNEGFEEHLHHLVVVLLSVSRVKNQVCEISRTSKDVMVNELQTMVEAEKEVMMQELEKYHLVNIDGVVRVDDEVPLSGRKRKCPNGDDGDTVGVHSALLQPHLHIQGGADATDESSFCNPLLGNPAIDAVNDNIAGAYVELSSEVSVKKSKLGDQVMTVHSIQGNPGCDVKNQWQ